MSFTLNNFIILPGDIILTRDYSLVSKCIQFITRSKFSHALLCVKEGMVIEATKDGVYLKGIHEVIVNKKYDIKVLRYKNLSEEQLFRIDEYARSKLSTTYSKKQAIYAGLKKKVICFSDDSFDAQFCSKLVAQSFQSANILLNEHRVNCTPADLESSNKLNVVDNCLIEAVDSIENNSAYIELRQSLFNQIRTVTKSNVQNFEDVALFLADNPKYDNDICEVINKSGYLDLADSVTSCYVVKFCDELMLETDVGYVVSNLSLQLKYKKDELDRYTYLHTLYNKFYVARQLEFFRIKKHYITN